MKKLLSLLLVIFIIGGLLASCDIINGLTPSDSDYKFNDFTASEKLLYIGELGQIIPFVPCNSYVVEIKENGLLLKTVGNTAEDLVEYLELFAEYTSSHYTDEDGTSHLVYSKGGVSLDIHSYVEEDKVVIEVLAYRSENSGDQGGDNNQGGNQGGDNNQGGNEDGGDQGGDNNQGDTPDIPHAYYDFDSDEKALFIQYIGAVIPFIPNDEYYIEGYYNETDYEHGINFYALGITEAEFEAYLDKIEDSGFEFYETYVDETYGNTWHCYISDDLVIDVSFYEYTGEYVVDLFVYSITLSEDGEGESGGSDDVGGGNSGDTPDTPVTGVSAGNGYIISATNGLGTIYFNGSVTDNRFNASTNRAEAVTVYLESAGSGYYLYFMRSGTKTYLVINDNSDGAAFTTSSGSATVFVWNATYSTLVVADTNNNRGFAVDPAKSYSNFKCYDISNGTKYSWGQYSLVDASGNSGGNSGGNNGSSGGNTGDGGSTTHTYTDFFSSDKALFNQYIGAVIPFIPNDEYYIEGYYDETDYENGINFYTIGNTQAEYEAYLAKIEASGFEFYETYVDEEYGDTWYCYISDDLVIDITYYVYEGDSVVDLFVYSITLSEDGEGGSGGDSGDTGNNGSSGGTNTSVDIITNEGAGLPADDDGDGIYNVDFTEAEKIKDVSDQGYYEGICPTTGSAAVLVIPVQFSDALATSRGYDLEVLKNAFLKDGDNDYFSVYDYYYISSYGQLDLDITILDFWFTPSNTSSYYARQTTDYYGSEVACGDQMILDEALKYLDNLGWDLSRFDSDGNGMIDAVVMINTLEIDSEDDFYWAYRYWNLYTDDDGYYYEYDGVSANDYLWASYQFLHEDGDGNYDDTSAINTYTFIHEFAHVIGAEDYYDTAYVEHPMDGYDMMDMMMGDHNAYTKFNYGWITESRLVVTEGNITISLEAFYKNGDTIILANDYNPDLGVYQEYYIIVYYTNDGLNTGNGGIFGEEGILVYHINASLYREEYEGEIYYDVYNTNTNVSDRDYGTEDNLIEYVENGFDYIYGVGDSLANDIVDDSGEALGYVFTVVSLDGETATLLITKI